MTKPHTVSRKSRVARIALPLLLAAGAAACAPSFKADVSRFNTTLPAPQGESFAVVAEDPKLAGGLEFSLYADQVGAELEKLGYVEATSPADASLLVRFDYGVDNGRERVRSDFGSFGHAGFGGFGRFRGFSRRSFFRSRYAFGFHDPFLAGPSVRSYTIYTSDIDVKIDSTASGERLFEGKAQAVSRSNRLPQLIPSLVDAMFTGFPGNSGETVQITIKDDGKKVRPVE